MRITDAITQDEFEWGEGGATNENSNFDFRV